MPGVSLPQQIIDLVHPLLVFANQSCWITGCDSR